MNKLLFTKYSNERSRDFSINTFIYQTDMGKVIKKTAAFPEGEKHILDIYRFYGLLKKQYSDSRFEINKCELADKNVNGSAEIILEYVEGDSFAKLVDEILINSGKEAAIAKIEEYIDLVIPKDKLLPFESVKQYEEIFGKMTESSRGSLAINNIDAIMQNMFCGNDKMTMIDYEWVFDFQIPCEFLIYRILHYYIKTHSIRAVLDCEEVYERFGLNVRLLTYFEQMEKRFQHFIAGDYIPVDRMYDSISPGEFNVQKFFGKKEALDSNSFLKIYFSENEELDEKNVLSFPIKKGRAEAEWLIPENIKLVRIDPGENACACTINRIEDENGCRIPFVCNGYFEQENKICFYNDDPNIYLETGNGFPKKLIIDFKIEFFLDEELTKKSNNMLAQLLITRKELEEKEHLIADKERTIDTVNGILKDTEKQLEIRNTENDELRLANDLMRQRLDKFESTLAYRVYRKVKAIGKH